MEELPGLLNQEGLDPSVVISFPHMVQARKIMDYEVLVEEWNKEVFNHEDLGRTTKAGISVALDVALMVENKNILVLGYDKIERY